jgi:hypothetical protein
MPDRRKQRVIGHARPVDIARGISPAALISDFPPDQTVRGCTPLPAGDMSIFADLGLDEMELGAVSAATRKTRSSLSPNGSGSATRWSALDTPLGP